MPALSYSREKFDNAKNPFCRNCKEKHCCISNDGTCEMIRVYLKIKRPSIWLRKDGKKGLTANCEWMRKFDGHFCIGCVNETGERANGNFKPDNLIEKTKWNFKFCPYCGNKIKIIYSKDRGEKNTRLTAIKRFKSEE